MQIKKVLQISWVSFLLVFTVGSLPAAQQGQLPEVTIKGSDSKGITSDKSLLNLGLDRDSELSTVLSPETSLLERQPEAFKSPSAGFSKVMDNDQIIIPARVRLAKEPVKVFYPLRDILAISPSQFQEVGTGWEMTITDSQGQAFRRFLGRGLPPANLPWNGRSEKSEIAQVGKSYSAVITYRDIRGQKRNYVTEPFAFDGIIHQEQNGLVVSLSLPSTFDGASSQVTLSPSGEELLREVADWVKRFYITYPIKIICYSPAGSDATERAQSAAQYLTRSIRMLSNPIPASGYVSSSDDARLDIVIANR